MHYLTTNPKVQRTHLEEHLLTVAQEMSRKNYLLGMIESYLGQVLEEWKSTRDKYRNAGTVIQRTGLIVEVKNSTGEVVFTIK
ncbi:hypothetical protein [Salmonirosea aquatica]|uniref:Uncharacterized protein n=1 Tax=Salmonirosea aquatica TaxID=2654236 RepID=A0A7C9FBA9_9BACT|nr:hypothetical protein [Cytophagaceae bacterium SJW1-29]